MAAFLLYGLVVKSYAQFVPVSDPNFRQFIQQVYPALLNASLELDTVQAATINGILDCRGRNITTIEEVKYFKSLSRIYAMNNRITSFPFLQNFNNLTYIVLDSNQLTELPQVNHISTLQELKCNYNRLSVLPSLTGLSNLIYLKCSYNQLSVLPDLTGLNNLIMLYCEGNQLTALPSLSGLVNLKELKCTSNQLTQLPDLSSLTKLVKLYAQQNQLTSLPSLSACVLLEDLFLDYNNLTVLPSLSGLTALRRLFCEHNELTSLPSLSGLAALRELKCGSNRLSSIPSLNGLSNLVFFYCDDNQLTALPSLSDCVNLDKLICSKNRITALPDLSNLTLLKRIFCSNNLLTTFPDPSGLTSLQGLFIYSNRINSLPSLSSCTNLTEIEAYNNNLHALPDLSFMTNVIKVDLKRNYLSFEDILPLASHPDFDMQFSVFPQKTFGNPDTVLVKETDSFTYSLNLDESITSNIYAWYFNGQFLKNTNDNFLTIQKMKNENAGEYYAIISNSDPRLDGIYLTFAVRNVELGLCMDLTGFRYVLPAVHCNEPYTLQINEELIGISQAPYIYELRNKSTGKVIRSNAQPIKGLGEGVYELTISDTVGCTKKISEQEIIAPRPSDCDAVFSPNGDGISDVYFVEENAAVRIYDNQGNFVYEFTSPGQWDGSTKSGELATSGYYVVVINGKQKRSVTLIR